MEWVRIEHPKMGIKNPNPDAPPVPGETGVVTRTSFDLTWKLQGWRIVKKPKPATQETD